jgi:hypothetical protein
MLDSIKITHGHEFTAVPPFLIIAPMIEQREVRAGFDHSHYHAAALASLLFSSQWPSTVINSPFFINVTRCIHHGSIGQDHVQE